MRYYIKRNEQEYGPYSEADLRKYVSEGSIVVTDMARPENSTQTMPVSQILSPPQTPPQPAPPQTPAWGSPVPQPQQQPQQQWGTPGGGTPQPRYGAAPAGQPGAGPAPPDLHWALVLVIGMACGIFPIVWIFMQANFVKKIDPNSKGMMLLILTIVLAFAAVPFFIGAAEVQELALVGVLLYLGAIVCSIAAWFNMRASLVRYYNSVEPYGLRLSGPMTFFFNMYYFQYHFMKIAEWKKTGIKR